MDFSLTPPRTFVAALCGAPDDDSCESFRNSHDIIQAPRPRIHHPSTFVFPIADPNLTRNLLLRDSRNDHSRPRRACDQATSLETLTIGRCMSASIVMRYASIVRESGSVTCAKFRAATCNPDANS